MYKAIIFDLDGTLLDTTSGVMYAVEHTIRQLGLPMLKKEILETFVGPPMQLSFQKHYAMNESDALQAANLFRANYKEHSLLKAELYSGTLEVLQELKDKGYKLAVATNKSHDNAMEILEHFQVAKYCDFMMGSDLEGKLKKADIIERCLQSIGVKADESVYVGDSIFDLEGAQKVGMDFYAVLYGFGFKNAQELQEYDCKGIFENIKAIGSVL